MQPPSPPGTEHETEIQEADSEEDCSEEDFCPSLENQGKERDA